VTTSVTWPFDTP